MSIDLAVVVVYLLGMAALGIHLSRYIKKDEDFFLAGRSLNKWVIAGTIIVAGLLVVSDASESINSPVVLP